MDVQLLCQALALLAGNVYYLLRAFIDLPFALLRCIAPRRKRHEAQGATFYAGEVHHHRRHPTSNKFTCGWLWNATISCSDPGGSSCCCCCAGRRYAVRMALVSLDAPPGWWKGQAADHLTADEARKLAETDGGQPTPSRHHRRDPAWQPAPTPAPTRPGAGPAATQARWTC
jgi:hypothetical protein